MKKNDQDLRVRSGTPSSIRESLKKSVTEMLVLFVLRKRPMYTYEMMQEIDTLSGGAITFNTLYQAIYRLQGFQYIAEHDKVVAGNRIRIYFAVTFAGEAYLEQLIQEYRDFTGAVDKILGLDRNGQGGTSHA